MFFFFNFTSKWGDDPQLIEIVPLSVLVNIIKFEFRKTGTNICLITTFQVIWMIGFVFILCEPGAIMTKQFEEFEDELSKCYWYLLPIKMQPMYMVLLSYTQNPVNISTFVGITCDRETSKKVPIEWTLKKILFKYTLFFQNVFHHFQVLNKAFSYFMTFRQFKP